MPKKLAQTRTTIISETKANRSKYVFIFLRILVVVLGLTWAVFWLSRGQRWSNLGAIFLRMNLGIFTAALLIFAVSQVLIGLRWWLLLRAQSISINLWTAVRLNFLGLFYNNFMPSSVGGDLLKAWFVTRHTNKRFEAALSVFVDRVIGLLSTLAIAVFFYVLFMKGQADKFTLTGQSLSWVFLAEHKRTFIYVLLALALVFCLLLLNKRGVTLLKRGWLYIQFRTAKVLSRLKNSIYIYFSKPLVILEVSGLTVFLQIFAITGFWFLGVNLGITASIKYYYIFFPLTWVLGVLPISIGGAVVVEGLLASFFFHFAHVEAEAALALALCQRIIWMIASLPGAAIHLTGTHLPKDFFVDYEQGVD